MAGRPDPDAAPVSLDLLYTDTRLVTLYDALNTGRADFDFWRDCLPAAPARILDLGCGTGTFAIELSGAGYDVTGLDPSPDMIAFASRKPGAGAVTWKNGLTPDISNADTGFDAAVMTGHAFQCLLEDSQIVALFEDMARILRPGGLFLFETRNRAFKAWKTWDGSIQKAASGAGQVSQRVLWVRDDLVCFEECYGLRGQEEPVVSRSTLRFANVHEISKWLGQAGFEISGIAGNWDDSAYDRDHSPEIIFQTTRI